MSEQGGGRGGMRGTDAPATPARDAAFSPVPPPARWLGYAGLLPQLAVLAALLGRDPAWRPAALALGHAYAALILSFLGGLWWGLAARSGARVPPWVWIAAVLPSLVALACALPWTAGAGRPDPSLGVLGAALVASLAVDRRMRAIGLAPDWWMALRVPLSVGLGLPTLAAAFL